MAERYRIRVNGNGQFMVQRRSFPFGWQSWAPFAWRLPQSGALYDTTEAAVAALLMAQQCDQKTRASKTWTTAVEEVR
jgi:hypothetical protein